LVIKFSVNCLLADKYDFNYINEYELSLPISFARGKEGNTIHSKLKKTATNEDEIAAILNQISNSCLTRVA